MSCFVNGEPVDLVPKELNGGVPVNSQDQTSPPIDPLFAREISPFTISLSTGVSGLDAGSFVYSFKAVGGHGLAVNDEILLLDVAANRSFFAIVIGVVIDDITVDRMIDHDFPVTSLGRKVTTKMNVNGLVTPKIFSVRAGSIPFDNTRFILTMTNTVAMDSGGFGGLAKLGRGLVFRIYNGFQKTVFNFKSNGEIKQFCFDGDYDPKAPAGTFGFFARISFAGMDKHGVALRISENDVLQWVVQDDLTGLTSLQVSSQGHEVTD